MLFKCPLFCKILLIFVFFAGLFSCHCQAQPSKTVFPEFRVLQSNIHFWEKIYDTYSINTAVLHDNRDLSLIYAEVPLLPIQSSQASALNKKYLETVKKTYRAALLHLATGAAPKTITEKRIQHLFSATRRKVTYKEAAENLRFQVGLKERFQEGVIRSGAYINEMKAIFQQYGLPQDLAYLPHVESSFNANAYSHLGAAGAWQFTKATGEQYLTINFTVDERRDIIASTHAAAQYLKNNFTNLGSWPLAITAYNYGHHGMRRAIDELGSFENIFENYQKGYFKFASRNFYAEFIAAVHIAKKLEKSSYLRLDRPRQSITYIMPGFMHVDALCRHFHIDRETLKTYNPALRDPVWDGEKYVPKGYKLRLPASDTIRSSISSLPASSMRSTQKQSLFYTVRRGDTLTGIAKMHKVTSSQLSRINNIDKKGTIRIGQTLRIPPMRSDGRKNEISTPDQPHVIRQNSKRKVTHALPSQPVALPAEKNSDYAITHHTTINGIAYGKIVVQPEESLALYATWLKTEKSYLQKLNGLRSDSEVYAGQTLSLPFRHTSEKLFYQSRLEFRQETEKDFYGSYKVTGIKTYAVSKGDTLWSLCQKKFDVPLWLLKKYNINLQFNNLKHNQVLKIPIIEAI